jgi:hypothetical protein
VDPNESAVLADQADAHHVQTAREGEAHFLILIDSRPAFVTPASRTVASRIATDQEVVEFPRIDAEA